MDGTEGGTAPKEDAAKERRGPLADVAGASKDEVKELNGAREEDDLERLCLSIISVERSDGKTMDSPPNIILPAGSFDQSQPRKQTLPVICCIYPTSPTLSVLNLLSLLLKLLVTDEVDPDLLKEPVPAVSETCIGVFID